ncbi:alpha/beta fold hydrolase [Sporosalibacterium faouarense]|uniref:alpha/beta fold hydrolase n=1 Tax=Sporosalibacterium faouarense TaxID=516123 RepID=UPI00192C9E78|nr:prolyl oligopeptidase family serine peptidase [Sporosalibacterium faouarense]
MSWSIFKHESEFVTTERIEVNDIPCLKIKPKGATGLLPTVLYYHGWHSSKEFQRFMGATFACYGYQVILPDALHHGERNPIDYDAEGMLEKYIWKIILQNVKESKGIIENIISDHNTDPDRIAVMGNSMGGISAAGIFVHNTNIKCEVIFNGSCDWLAIDKLWRKMGNLNEDTANAKKLAEYDSVTNQDKLHQRPILMLHGDSDTSVPIQLQRGFFEKVSDSYKEFPQMLKLIETERLDHYKTTSMVERAIEWLKEYL